jgi:hypothetical protein
MNNILDGNARGSLSTVVAFKGRDLIEPKGIDGGEMLAWASAEELLAYHLELGCDAKAFWKDGFLLYALWAMGDFCGMIPPGRGSSLYPYNRTGFCQFLRDHGSQIRPEEATRRIKVFRAYNRFEVTIIRMVEKAGLNKSLLAIPYIRDETVIDLMRLCIKTPYHRIRPALQEAYPRTDRPRERDSMPKEELRRAAERRALRVIAENEYGMIGDPGIFIPRQYRQHAEDELRAQEVFEIAMSRLGTDDRDAFFMRVVELVAKTWLTKDDRQAVEQLLSEQCYFDRAQP